MGVQLPRHAPINLRVGKSGNPRDLESGDPVFESPRADHICFAVIASDGEAIQTKRQLEAPWVASLRSQ
jgi:hypothetical protein